LTDAALGGQDAGEAYGMDTAAEHWFSRAGEWYLVACFAFVMIEGVFYAFVDYVITNRTIFLARLTPYNLWPSVEFFYGLGLVIGLGIILTGRRWWHVPSQGRLAYLGVWFVFLGWGIWGAIRHNVAWFQDIRGFILPAVVVPWVTVLAQNVRYDVVFSRLLKVAVPLAVVNFILGVLFFARGANPDPNNVIQPSWRGEYVLILAYLIAFARSVTTGTRSTTALVLLAVGIAAPLHKPTLGTFVIANLFLVLLAMHTGRRQGTVRIGKAVLVIGLLVVVLGGLTQALFAVGKGATQDFLRRKILKEGVPGGDVTGGRFDMWRQCLIDWSHSPLIGEGLGARLTHERDDRTIALPIHNIIIHLLKQTGLLGAVIVGLAVFTWVHRAVTSLKLEWLSVRFWPRLALTAYACAILFASLYGDAVTPSCVGFTFWMVIGMETAAHSQVLAWTEGGAYGVAEATGEEIYADG